MRAVLVLLLILAAIVFVSFYGDALRPYWQERLPRVAGHLGEGDLRQAASAMVEEPEEEAPPSSMVVATTPNHQAEPDTSRQDDGQDPSHTE
jgi:hypothetical protein